MIHDFVGTSLFRIHNKFKLCFLDQRMGRRKYPFNMNFSKTQSTAHVTLSEVI